MRSLGRSRFIVVVLVTALVSGLPFEALAELGSAGGQETVTPPPILSPETSRAPKKPETAETRPERKKPKLQPAKDRGQTIGTSRAAKSRFVQGKSREITAERSATQRVFENPDGTRTARVFSDPVMMPDGAGGWRDIDTTLVEDGERIRTRATPAALDFARGGDAPVLARVQSGDRVVGFALQGARPVSAVPAEHSVTYREVQPGVDLRLTALRQGVKEELILRSRNAPDTYVFPLQLQGLSASVEPATGDVVYRDSSGAEVGRTPAGFMEDAAVDPHTDEGVISEGVHYELVDDGAGGTALKVTLDRGFLDDPARRYPVVVDPSYWLSTDWPDDTFVMQNFTNNNSGDPELKVGTYDDGVHVGRSFMNFDVNGLNGKDILYAQFNVLNIHSWSCQARGMGVYRVTQAWGGTTMTGFPGATYDPNAIAWAAFAKGYSASCPDDWTSWDITPTVHNWTHGIWPQFGLMMREDTVSTNDSYAWKKFASWNYTNGGWATPRIDIDYNNRPSQPQLVRPGHGESFHQTHADLAVQSTDADNDTIWYFFDVCLDPGLTQCFWTSDWHVGGNPTVYDLDYNRTYYWRVQAYDGEAWAPDSPVWQFTTTNGRPNVPATGTPANNEVLSTLNLKFTTPGVSDPENDGVEYQFQVASGTNGKAGTLATSPWLPAGQTEWVPPDGTFSDGGRYSWIVRARDTKWPDDFTAPADPPWSAPSQFRIDFRLGKRPTLPYDDAGPAVVNLSNGNLVLSVGGPTFQTVGDPVGVGFVYNSQAPRVNGLTGLYYQDTDADMNRDQGEPMLLRRLDPQVNFDWGTGSPAPNVVQPDWFNVSWSGSIRKPATEPATDFVFLVDLDDHVDVSVNGASVLNTGCCGTFTSSPFTLASDSGRGLDITFKEAGGHARVALRIKKVGDPDWTAFPVPADWLTPTLPVLPDGWSRTGDSLAPDGFTALRPLSDTTTVLVDSSGADHVYSASPSGTGWVPPADEDAVLTRLPDGSWTLAADDGYLYSFAADGRLTGVVSPVDASKPGALTYSYTEAAEGRPMRLTTIADATGRVATLTYGGGSGTCPSASGYSAAPPDMLCKIAYTGFGGGSTDLYYSNGHLARIEDPGGERVDFGYDADGRLVNFRGALTNDLITYGRITDGADLKHRTEIAYADNKVASITMPVPDGAADAVDRRPQRTYQYTPSTGLPTTTQVHVTGLSATNTKMREVSFDSAGHATVDRDAAGIAVDQEWDAFEDRVTKSVDHHHDADPTGGLTTTYFYDAAGNLTETYGPGSETEFAQAGNKPTSAPHTLTEYDGGISGLGASWYDNEGLASAPKAHTTSSLNHAWGVGSPAAAVPANGFSGRLTGEITVPGASNATVTVTADGARLFVDDDRVVNTWGGPYRAAVEANGPAHHWRLGEPSTASTAADSAGFAPGAYASSVTRGTTGAVATDTSTAATFNGAAGTNITATDTMPATGVTLEAWVNLPDTMRRGAFVMVGAGGNGYGFGVGGGSFDDGSPGNKLIGLYEYQRWIDSGVSIGTGWHHVAMTIDGAGTATFFVDGVQRAQSPGSAPLAPGSAIAIGGYTVAGQQRWFNGSLDEVALYRSVLSASQIQAHYQAASQTTSTATATVTPGTHRVRLEYQELAGDATLQVSSNVAGTSFKPRYGLPTSVRTAEQGGTPPTYRETRTEYASPELGLATASVVDPNGANLRTTTAYEPPGTGFLRRTGRRLPAAQDPYSGQVTAQSPLGYWRLGEATGTTAADASGNGNHGAYTLGYTLGRQGAIVGEQDTSTGFNGIDGQVQVPDTSALRLNGSFTIEFWAKQNAFANTYPGLVRKGESGTADGYLVYYSTDGKLTLKRNNTYVSTSTGKLSSTSMRHFALTYDGTTVRWYVDGVADTSATMTYPANNGTSSLRLGRGDHFGNHNLDEVAIYGTALSAAELARHAAHGTNGTAYTYHPHADDPATTTVDERRADNPCTTGTVETLHQGGGLRTRTGADPDGADTALVEEFVYDEAGRVLASRVNGGSWTCSAYDSRGRVTTSTHPAFDGEPARTSVRTWVVSSDPAITQVYDGSGALTTTTDWLGRTTSYRDAWDLTTTTTYDRANRVTDTSNFIGTTHVDYDTASRPVSQKVDGLAVATATYNANSGLAASYTYPTGTGNGGNGTSGAVRRDARGRLDRIEWRKPDGTVLASDQVTRSLSGSIVDQFFDATADPRSGPEYTYDGAGRLTEAWAPDGTGTYHKYTYGFGASSSNCSLSTGRNTNRSFFTETVGTTTVADHWYCYDRADRLVATSDSRYTGTTYDSRGSTKTLGTQSLRYDGSVRHTETTVGSTKVRYLRDPEDRIMARSVTTGTATIAFRAASNTANATGNTLVMQKPAGAVAGDVMVAAVATRGAPTITAPSGWTQIRNDANGTTMRQAVYYRVVGSSDPANWTWTFSASVAAAGGVYAYSGVSNTAPVNDRSRRVNTTSSTNVNTFTVTPSISNAQVVGLFAGAANTTFNPPSVMTERGEVAAVTGPDYVAVEGADMAWPTPAVSGTPTATMGTAAPSIGHLVVLNPASHTHVTRYAHTGPGDAADITLDANRNPVDRHFSLFGGVSLRKKSGADVWSYPNIDGDTLATANSTGVKQGSTSTYDPYGQALAGVPDNADGNYDFGWLGQHQRGVEREAGLHTIEMGARQYVPGLGRFLEVDPVEGGCANDYAYVYGDPVNAADIDGRKACNGYSQRFAHGTLHVVQIGYRYRNGRYEKHYLVYTEIDSAYVGRATRSRMDVYGKNVNSPKLKRGRIGNHDTRNHPYKEIRGSDTRFWAVAGDTITFKGSVDWRPNTVDRGSFGPISWYRETSFTNASCTA